MSSRYAGGAGLRALVLKGLDAARARGRVGGRSRALTSEQIGDARILLGAGQTRTAVAAKLRVSRWTLRRALDNTPLR